MTKDVNWYVYIVECSDNSLYTGVTTDLVRRVKEHNGTKAGARSLKGKLPVKLVFSEKAGSQSEALKREHIIKSWRKSYKVQLIQGKF